MSADATDPVLEREFEHEELHVVRDAHTGLVGAIAVHSTVLGPAVGGLRLARYANLDAAVEDALRLSRAMTLKNSAAGLDLGGGKAVLVDDGEWGDPAVRRARMLAFGRALDRVQGRYITAEDVGTSPADMSTIAEATSFVVGLPDRSGDPSAATARTVFAAIAAAVARRHGRDLTGVRVGVLGVGHVGSRLAALLAAAGAEVTVADIDPARATATAEACGGLVADLDGFTTRAFDVLAPCALGGAITRDLVGELRCDIVCGAANNPLAGDDVAVALHLAGILYVPDFLANCGGIIHVGAADVLGCDPAEVDARIESAVERIRDTLAEAEASERTPLAVAREMADRRLADAFSLSVSPVR